MTAFNSGNNGEFFHIDLGHVLGHVKYKFGVRRERYLAQNFAPKISRPQGLDCHPVAHLVLVGLRSC
jgi:hypothetical protein